MPRGVQTHRDIHKNRDFPFKESPEQVYGTVTKLLGNGRVTCHCDDDAKRLCRIRGKMRKREWVHVGDTVLVSLRPDDASDVGDIVFRYTDPEVSQLQRLGEYSKFKDDVEPEDDTVVFEDPDAI